MLNHKQIALLLIVFPFMLGCDVWAFKRVLIGSYRGQVIDAETKQPVRDAVVLVYWNREIPAIAEAVESFLRAEEAITDANGRFRIGTRLAFSLIPMTGTGATWIEVFKRGYGTFPYKHATAKPVGGYEAAMQRGDLVIQLVRATSREEKLEAVRDALPSIIPARAMPNLMSAVNNARHELGLQPERGF